MSDGYMNSLTPVAEEMNGEGIGAAIKNVKLKKATPVQKQQDVRGGLLDEIKRGAQLKTVIKDDKKNEPKEGPLAPGLGGIMGILARRQAIKGSSDDDEGSGDDEWED